MTATLGDGVPARSPPPPCVEESLGNNEIAPGLELPWSRLGLRATTELSPPGDHPFRHLQSTGIGCVGPPEFRNTLAWTSVGVKKGERGDRGRARFRGVQGSGGCRVQGPGF